MKTLMSGTVLVALMITAPCWACTDPPGDAACARYSALTTFRKIYGQQAASLVDARAAVEASDYGRRAEKVYYDDCVANGVGK
jgi:hypothetical protein